MGLENYFRQIPTLHSRDFCPTGGPSNYTKFGARGTPNSGAFDGEVETLTPNSSAIVHFSGPKFISGKGHRGALPTCQNWGSSGIPFGPPNFYPLEFATYSPVNGVATPPKLGKIWGKIKKAVKMQGGSTKVSRRGCRKPSGVRTISYQRRSSTLAPKIFRGDGS